MTDLPEIISLFCGSGGLDWGFHREGFRIPLAIDHCEAAIKTHKRNFPETEAVNFDLVKLGPAGVLKLTQKHVASGARIGIIGGPPCQGFSRANVQSQSEDPRNTLPSLYLQIVEKLQKKYIVEFVIFENVLGIRDKRHAATYEAILQGLILAGFSVKESELCALDYGVPQNRKRIVLSAVRTGPKYGTFRIHKRSGPSTVLQAIGLLDEPAFYSPGLKRIDIPVHPNHWTMRPKSPRFRSPRKFRSDGRSFKLLRWEEASPTIAFGNREIHVHPNGNRRISIYEAMLLQGFPHDFVLEGNLSEQVQQISNAVPPPLARSLAAAIRRSVSSAAK